MRGCMLIYSEAREQSPAAANTLLQIQIAPGLWCDRRPKVRHLMIYLLHIPSSPAAAAVAGQGEGEVQADGTHRETQKPRCSRCSRPLTGPQEQSSVRGARSPEDTEIGAPLALRVSRTQRPGSEVRGPGGELSQNSRVVSL